MRVRILATPRLLVSHACGGGPQPKPHGQGGMDMEALLDAGQGQVGERQAPADCPTCRVKVNRPAWPALGSGVQAQIRARTGAHPGAMTAVRLPGPPRAPPSARSRASPCRSQVHAAGDRAGGTASRHVLRRGRPAAGRLRGEGLVVQWNDKVRRHTGQAGMASKQLKSTDR